ncbi:TPA: restriction endonuclease subunit S, partial [Klebsiella pneumoniae]
SKERFSTSLGSISEDIRYGTSKKCSENEGDTAVLRIPNIGSGHIIDSNLKYAYFDEKELYTLSLKKGDLLLIRSNGSVDLVGKVAMVSEKDTGFLYAGYLIRIRLDLEMAVPEYVTYCLQSPQVRQVIENIARSTSGVNNINSKELSSLILPIPSLEEQNKVIKDVDKYLSCISIFETMADNALSRINNLTQSILAKAFRGELTAQWREENPELINGLNSAEALLEKITAEKLAAGTVKKHTKKTSR